MTTSAENTTPPAAPWVPDASTFGARLALVRQKMGWGNVKVAAQECGVPVESWRNWERDGMEPRRLVTIAMAISTRTGVDLDWLVYGPSRQRAAQPTGRYAPRNPLEPRLIAPVRHGDGRRNRSKNVGRMADQPATSTSRNAAVSQNVLA